MNGLWPEGFPTLNKLSISESSSLMAHNFPLALGLFQKETKLHSEQGRTIFVSAHTSFCLHSSADKSSHAVQHRVNSL